MIRRYVVLFSFFASVVVSLAPAAFAAPDPLAGAPVVGSCYDMSVDELFANSCTEASVDCAGTHTSKVVFVGTLPDGTSFDDTAALTKFVLKNCEPAISAILGQPLTVTNKTAYGSGWFIPTAFQRSNGARWIRCDLLLWKGTTLQPLPTDTAPFIPTSTPDDTVARCLTPKTFYWTTCNKTHVYRATHTKSLSLASYPGAKKLAAITIKKCRGLVSTPSNFRYAYPTKLVWNVAHDHVIICYSHTSS